MNFSRHISGYQKILSDVLSKYNPNSTTIFPHPNIPIQTTIMVLQEDQRSLSSLCFLLLNPSPVAARMILFKRKPNHAHRPPMASPSLGNIKNLSLPYKSSNLASGYISKTYPYLPYHPVPLPVIQCYSSELPSLQFPKYTPSSLFPVMTALSLTLFREPLRGTSSKRPSLTFLWEIGSSTTQYSLHFIEVNTHRSSVFYKLKDCGNPALSKFVGTFLQIA